MHMELMTQTSCPKLVFWKKNEKGRSFIKGYLAIKWHFGLINYPNKCWARSEDLLKKQAEIKKVMTYKTFQVMNKHFAVVNKDQLPLKGTPEYHLLQNISAGVQVLKENFAALWESGSMLCIDEGRVKSKSKRNPYKIRNPEKANQNGVDNIQDWRTGPIWWLCHYRSSCKSRAQNIYFNFPWKNP